jgi:hypothetical protein
MLDEPKGFIAARDLSVESIPKHGNTVQPRCCGNIDTYMNRLHKVNYMFGMGQVHRSTTAYLASHNHRRLPARVQAPVKVLQIMAW